jgi:cell division transport system permease protein
MRSDNLRTVAYAFLSVVTNFKKNAFLHVTSIFTVFICFFVLGGGLNIFFNVRSMLNLSKLQTHVSAYLNQELNESELGSFRQKHCMQSFIAHCKYMSAAEAKAKFSEKNPDLRETLAALDDNPFPPSVEIDFEKDFKSIETLRQFSKDIAKEKSVLYVDDGGKWVTNWLQILSLFDRLTYLLGFGFALMVAFVISNTIQLLVYSRKDEVEILSLVGATRNIIRLPFMTEGVLHGLLGSILALVCVKLFFVWAARYIHQIWPGLLPGQIVFIPWAAQLMLVALSSMIGWFGSYIAVGKFLK